MTDINDNLTLFTLPQDLCPGSDVMSRIMLKDSRLIDIVVKDLVGNHASSALYTLGRCEWTNKSVSDVLYLPVINPSAFPSILVEIQNKVHENFIGRAIKYCISLKEEYGVLPIMLIFSIKGFSNTQLKRRLTNNNNSYLDDISCDFWAQKCQIISPSSIENHLLQTPLNPLIALEYFLSQQKRNILFIKKKEDPTIQLLYQVGKEKFENECQVKEEKLVVIKDLCLKAKHQFQKILTCLEEGGSTDKVVEYAKDGEAFFFRQERKFTANERDVTPIEDTPDISDISIPQTNNNSAARTDFDYIEDYKTNNSRMRWEACYDTGKREGFFSTYVNSHALKSAYHNEMARLHRRIIADITE